MASTKNYFEKQPEPDLPRIRAWRSYRRRPGVDHVRVEILREKDGLTTMPARVAVSFERKDNEIEQFDEAPWEPALERWLIDEERALATSTENEKLRFSLLLKPELRPALVRFGDGYFNAVLVLTIADGPYGDNPEVADMLKSIHEDAPAGGSKQDCEAMIDHGIANVARRVQLLYPTRSTADDILAGAIARYLDDRFSVSDSRSLGL